MSTIPPLNSSGEPHQPSESKPPSDDRITKIAGKNINNPDESKVIPSLDKMIGFKSNLNSYVEEAGLSDGEINARKIVIKSILEVYPKVNAQLDLSGLSITSLPDCMKDLPNIDSLCLDIGHTGIVSLPKGITKLGALLADSCEVFNSTADLKNVEGVFFVSNCSAFASTADLKDVGGVFGISNCSAFISAEKLEQVGGNFQVSNCGAFISAEKLKRVGGNFQVSNCGAFISADKLERVDAVFFVSKCGAFISVESLKSVGGNFNINLCPAFNSLSHLQEVEKIKIIGANVIMKSDYKPVETLTGAVARSGVVDAPGVTWIEPPIIIK